MNLRHQFNPRMLFWLVSGILFWSVILAPFCEYAGHEPGWSLPNLGRALIAVVLSVLGLLYLSARLTTQERRGLTSLCAVEGREFLAFFFPLAAAVVAAIVVLVREAMHGRP